DVNAVTFVAPESTLAPSEPSRSSGRYPRAALPSAVAHAVTTLLAEHAPALSMLVPESDELRVLVAEPGLGRTQGSEGERERLVSSICRFLVDLSLVRPLVLYCSDLHWADEPTVQMLARLSRAIRA